MAKGKKGRSSLDIFQQIISSERLGFQTMGNWLTNIANFGVKGNVMFLTDMKSSFCASLFEMNWRVFYSGEVK